MINRKVGGEMKTGTTIIKITAHFEKRGVGVVTRQDRIYVRPYFIVKGRRIILLFLALSIQGGQQQQAQKP
jgi:hypothetical protein